MKKRLIVLLFILLGVFPLLVSCSKSGEDVGGSENNATVETTRKIYYTVYYTIESQNISEIEKDINNMVRNLEGYVSNSVTNEDESRYVYRVPTNKLNEFLDYVDSFGENVSDKTLESTDITTKYSETEARKEVLEASKAAYLKLLEEENLSISEIMSIQNKIEDINAELLSIYNQLSSYDSLLDYSIITITYEEEPKFMENYGGYLIESGKLIIQIILYVFPFGLVIAFIIFLINLPTYIRKRKARKSNSL